MVRGVAMVTGSHYVRTTPVAQPLFAAAITRLLESDWLLTMLVGRKRSGRVVWQRRWFRGKNTPSITGIEQGSHFLSGLITLAVQAGLVGGDAVVLRFREVSRFWTSWAVDLCDVTYSVRIKRIRAFTEKSCLSPNVLMSVTVLWGHNADALLRRF